MNRVVVFQGQYGVFPTRGLSLSMPAVQTCIGVLGIHDSGQTVVAAHFDTDQMLEANIGVIENKMPRGHQWRDYDVTIFGGDGAASMLRCGRPSTYIGQRIQACLRQRGCTRVQYTSHYSGLIPRTFNLQFEHDRPRIIEGQSHRFFDGYHPTARHVATNRIRKRPSEYTVADACMLDVTDLYVRRGR